MEYIAVVQSDLLTERDHRRIIKNVFRHVMEQHARQRMRKHFRDIPETRSGGAYGYEPRTQKYTSRKKRLFGHTKPLVFSGKMGRVVLTTGKVTATRKGSRYRARNYFRLSKQRRAELEAISPKERIEIVKGVERLYLREIAKPENRRKRKRRSK